MLRSLRPARTALLFAPLWTACAASPPPLPVRLAVPSSLLVCQAQPEPPARLNGDADLAYYIMDLAAAGGDCRGKVDALRGLLGTP